ncbi:MAG TPA: DciA family protein [Xanthobacteraceae bacterium]
MNKPGRSARPLADLLGPCLVAAFKRHGFASTEIVTHWADIVGADIAAHAEPIKITWPRQSDPDDPEPATLVLRCEGPAAIEIQHQADVIVERINRFLGWRAIARIALRQAPLARREKRRPPVAPDTAEAGRIADQMTGIADEHLRAALGRLGAAVKRR